MMRPMRCGLFDLVAERDGDTGGLLSRGGFVHGVLNSDKSTSPARASTTARGASRPIGSQNSLRPISITPGFTLSRRQPEAIHWDLAQLAGCLSLIADAPALSELLAGWSGRFEEALTAALIRRLGVAGGDGDRALAGALLRALATKAQTIDRIFFDWRGGRDPGALLYPRTNFGRSPSNSRPRSRPVPPYWSDPEPCSMHIEEVEVIWDEIAERDDWRPFHNKIKAIRRMGEALTDQRRE